MADLEYKDLAGNSIAAGDFIVYAASLGRCPILKYGIVTRLETRKEAYVIGRERDNTPTIRVITAEKVWRWTGPDRTRHEIVWSLQKKGGEVALAFLDRMLVVSVLNVPVGASDILTESYEK